VPYKASPESGEKKESKKGKSKKTLRKVKRE